jgi:hypothetical protein
LYVSDHLFASSICRGTYTNSYFTPIAYMVEFGCLKYLFWLPSK